MSYIHTQILRYINIQTVHLLYTLGKYYFLHRLQAEEIVAINLGK